MCLIHKKCGNNLRIDVSSSIRFQSSGIIINEKGIEPGAIELVQQKQKKSTFLVCPSCSIDISKSDISKDVVCTCLLCQEKKGIENSFYINQIQQVVCEDCINYIKSGSNEKISNEERRFLYDIVREYVNGNLQTMLSIILKSCK